MVKLYLCKHCEKGNHSRCERTTPMPKGCVSGGRKCYCPCDGDPNYNSPAKIHKQLEKMLKKIISQENVDKNTNVSVD